MDKDQVFTQNFSSKSFLIKYYTFYFKLFIKIWNKNYIKILKISFYIKYYLLLKKLFLTSIQSLREKNYL